MSFILEALKKADAERDRGAVPDLHAQAMLPEAAFEGDSGGRARPWLWLLAGAGVALLASVAWQWLGSDAPAVETVAAPAPKIAAPLPASGLATASMPSSTASLPPGTSVNTARARTGVAIDTARATHSAKSAAAAREDGPNAKREPPTRSGPRTGDAEPRDTSAKPDADSGKPATAKTEARSDVTPPSRYAGKDATKDAGNGGAKSVASDGAKNATKDATKLPQPAPEHVPLLTELPEDVRRLVPALKLGGLVYSAAPASRMVLVNGDIQREGSTVAPGLTLERIKPKSAVFSLRGQRFEVPL